MLMLADAGLAPPCWPENESVAGLTESIGVVETVPLPYPESGQSENDWPDVQLAGRVVKPVVALSSPLHGPLARSRKNMAPVPEPRIAIQYLAPEVTLTAGTVIPLNAAVLMVVMLPCVSSAPGWPALS